MEDIKIETNIFDKEEIYPNCTVQILTNTVTGEVSVGWWKNPKTMTDVDEDEIEADFQKIKNACNTAKKLVKSYKNMV